MDGPNIAVKQPGVIRYKETKCNRNVSSNTTKRSLPPRHSFLTDAVEAVLRKESQVWEPCIDGDTVLCIATEDTASIETECIDKQNTEPTVFDTSPKTPMPNPVFTVIHPKGKEKSEQSLSMDEVPDDEFYIKRHRRHEREEKRQKNREKEQLLHDMYQQQQFIEKVKAADKSVISAIAASLRQQDSGDDNQPSSSSTSSALDGDTIYRKILQDAEDQLDRFEALGLLKRKSGKKSETLSPSSPPPPLHLTTPPFDAGSSDVVSMHEPVSGHRNRQVDIDMTEDGGRAQKPNVHSKETGTASTKPHVQRPSSSASHSRSKGARAQDSSRYPQTEVVSSLYQHKSQSESRKRELDTTADSADMPVRKKRITSFVKYINGSSKKTVRSSSSRRSSRYATAFGQRIPTMEECEFTLPHFEYASLMYDRLRKYV